MYEKTILISTCSAKDYNLEQGEHERKCRRESGEDRWKNTRKWNCPEKLKKDGIVHNTMSYDLGPL